MNTKSNFHWLHFSIHTAFSVVFLAFIILTLTDTTARAAINEQINYQGRLLDDTGAVVADGTYNLTFKIYSGGDGAPGGSAETLEWTETREGGNKVTVTNGYFSVNLGSVNDFGTDIDWNEGTLWLGVEVGGTGTPDYTDGVLSPYKRFAANPYALNSLQFNGLTTGNFVQLAQGVQTDSSASNASIFINKTGATADILNLQRAGTSVLLIGNGGSTAFKTTTDSTTGFQINDADGGTPVFNVDTTNERVGIGTASPATALDVNGTATATLFSGSGASLTSLNATNISSGTLADARLSANVSLLGSSISGSEIVDNTIEEVDLEVTNAPTDNYVLSYDSGTGGFTWVVDDDTPSGSAGGDLTGTYPNPTVAANAVALGTDTTGNYVANVTGNSQISVGGSAGEGWTPTLSIQGDSIGDTQLQYNTGQDLTTSSSPTFSGLTSTANSDITRGGGTGSLTRTLTLGGARGTGSANFSQFDFVNYDTSGTSADFTGARIGSFRDGADDAGLEISVATDKTLGSAAITILSNKNVGIGDGSPNSLLTVGASDAFQVNNSGVITAGSYQGTAITDTYISDTLTVGSGGTVDWTALNNYPAACSAGNAITALGDSPTCSAFAAASSITLQNAYNTTSGNTITTTDGRDLSVTLANTTTDPNFIVNIATSAGGKFAVQNNSTDAFRVDSSGIDLVDVDVADFTGATVTFDTDEITDAEIVNALTVTGGTIDSTTTIDKDPVITLGTDLSGNVTLSNLASGTLNATIGANAVALTTDTTGNYVQSANTSVLTGLTGGSAGSEGAALTLGFDYSQALSGDPALAANAGVFGQSGLVFEGSTANTAETFLAVTNPTADRTITFPDTSGEVSLLGSSISGSEIVDNTIEEVDLEATNTPTDNYILSYDTGTGGFTWEVDQNTTYSAGNDLDLSGTTFDIESQLDSVSTISRASSNLTLQTTTSGDVNVSPAGDFNVDSNTLYVDSSANSVGIRNSSPATPLDIDTQSNSSGIRLRGAAETTEIADIYVNANGSLNLSTANSGASGAFIDVDGNDDNWGLILRDSNSGTGASSFANLYMNDAATDYLNIAINATNGTKGLVIDDADNVGIGDTTPSYKLDVTGDIRATANVRADSLYFTSGTQPNNFTLCYTGSSPYRVARCTSTRDSKKNIEDLEIGLSTINQLRPVYFEGRESSIPDLGFIAEEVNETEPLLAVKEEDGDLIGVKYEHMSALLAKGIQELDDKVEKISKTKSGAGGTNASASEITELSEKVDDLTKRLDEIAPESDGAVQGLSTINQNQMPLSSGIFGAIAGALAVALYVSRKKEKQPKQKAVPFRLY